MSEADLNALEREVELTRAKFANDLARLRSPHTLAEFKEDLWAHARDIKNSIVADLKARAVANPGAVAALAAGLSPTPYRDVSRGLGLGRIAADIAVASGLRQGRRFFRSG